MHIICVDVTQKQKDACIPAIQVICVLKNSERKWINNFPSCCVLLKPSLRKSIVYIIQSLRGIQNEDYVHLIITGL